MLPTNLHEMDGLTLREGGGGIYSYSVLPLLFCNTLPQLIVGFGSVGSIKVQPYAFETAYQCLKHFIYVLHGSMKRSEVGIRLDRDVMTSFSLLK